MQLTKRQLVWAHAPYSATVMDLYKLMHILSDREMWELLGDERIGVLHRIYNVAKIRHVPIPILFEQAFWSINIAGEHVIRVS